MSIGWTAGGVRARQLAGRGIGPAGALELAQAGSLAAAVERLATTAYGPFTAAGLDLPALQRGLSSSVLWHLRVLSGWLPPGGAELARTLAAPFELANIVGLAAALDGAAEPAPFQLGSLAGSWSALRAARTPHALRQALARSAWGDPGAEGPAAIARALRGVLWLRLFDALPDLERLLLGRLALALGSDILQLGEARAAPRGLPPAVARALPADELGLLRGRLPGAAAWALDGVVDAESLARAEQRWLVTAAAECARLTRSAPTGPRPVIGAVGSLAVDAWLCSAALECAARGDPRPLREALDAVA